VAAEREAMATGVRVALFTDTFVPQVNGVARTLDRFVQALRSRGGEARVFTTTDPHAGTREHGITRWPSVPFWGDPHLRMAPVFRARAHEALAEWAPSVVFAATPFGIGLAGRSAALALGIPLVTSYHTHFAAYARFYGLRGLERFSWRALRWFHNAGLRTYCPTRTVARELGEHGIANLELWSRGVEHARFHPGHRSRALRHALGARDDRTLVVYVGRISREKNIDLALRAMRIANATLPGRFAFAFAGDGPYLARTRGLAPAGTAFTGRLSGTALSEFYASADLMLFPSTTDTFGNVLLEALASGVPVIAAHAGPTAEILAPASGVMVPPDDADAMAAEMVALALDGGRRRSLGAAALTSAAAFNWETVFDDLIGDLRDVA
jgi:phosphatidylinositol alpha 1,6-mannosyltransferase